MSVSVSAFGTGSFAAAGTSEPYGARRPLALWTTSCRPVSHSAAGTCHCAAAAWISIARAEAPAWRKASKKSRIDFEPSVFWSP